MAVAFYIPSVDEDDQQVKPNQAYHQQYQQQQQQQQSQQSGGASPNMSQQVCSAEYGLPQQHLMLLFHEILVAYAREAVLAQQAASLSSPVDSSPCCMLCKKLYYLFRRIY